MPAPRHARRKRLEGRPVAVAIESAGVPSDLCFAAPRYFCEYTKKRAPAPRPLPPERPRTCFASPVVAFRRPMPLAVAAITNGVPPAIAATAGMVAGPPRSNHNPAPTASRAHFAYGRTRTEHTPGRRDYAGPETTATCLMPVRRNQGAARGLLARFVMGALLHLPHAIAFRHRRLISPTGWQVEEGSEVR